MEENEEKIIKNKLESILEKPGIDENDIKNALSVVNEGLEKKVSKKFRDKLLKRNYMLQALAILMKHENMKKLECEVCHEPLTLKAYTPLEKISEGKFVVIDHKTDGDGEHSFSDTLWREIIKSSEEDLDKYQILCDSCNKLKGSILVKANSFKNSNKSLSDKLLEIYKEMGGV